MQKLKNIFALLGVVALAYFAVVFINFIAHVTITHPEDLIVWKTIGETWNSEQSAVAIVEMGNAKSQANTGLFYRVSLKSKADPEHELNHSEVWEGRTDVPPVVSWLAEDELSISHAAQSVLLYKPLVRMLSGLYRVSLNINYEASGNASTGGAK